MNWIDKANKKLEEQRDKFQESIDSGETSNRINSYAASCVSKETRSKAGTNSRKAKTNDEHRISELKKGVNKSKKHLKASIKNIEKGRNSPNRINNVKKSNSKKSTCPHCGKTGGANTMPRWHFDNCKSLKDQS